MTANLWPCACDPGGPSGVKNLGARGYCSTCLTELLATFDPAAFELNGVWMLDGVTRPDHGPRYAECRCLACGAGAVAVVGTPCAYCEHARERLARWQAEILLWPELPDPADRLYEPAFEAWTERLAVAVDAEIITRNEARTAWDRMAPNAA